MEKKTNIFAILGLVFAFVSSVIGIVLSIIGLSKAKELNNGHGMALAGLIISIIFTVIRVILVIVAILFYIGYIDEVFETDKCSSAYNCVKVGDEKVCKYKNDNGYIESVTCPILDGETLDDLDDMIDDFYDYGVGIPNIYTE